jgi:predicted PurR-regulated permease PerM
MDEPTNNPADERSGLAETITTALRQPTFLRVILALATSVVVLVGLRLAAPILFAVILALLCVPIYAWLRRRRSLSHMPW